VKQQQIIDSLIMQIENTFDAAGNQITTTPTGSGATPWTNTFRIVPQFHPSNPDTDNFNRIAVVDETTDENVITYEPDFLGLPANIKYGDYAAPAGTMSYAYDRYLRVVRLHSNEQTRYLDITLYRDFLGNIMRRQEPAQSPASAIDYAYTYDGMNRLSAGEGESETYDDLSNLVTKGTAKYVYQDPDEANSDQMRLASFNDGTQHDYTYDANGNPTSITNKFSSLAFDNLNMLRRIVHTQTDDHWYNSAGLRVKKTEDSGGTWKTTYTLFDGNNPLMQEVYTASGRVQVTFNITVGGKILAQYKRVYPSTDSIVYFYLDNLDSRRSIVNASGIVIDRYRYSAWGVATQDAGSDDYRSFTGKDYDATGLIYFNARYYDPIVGRFVTEDPARNRLNWYAYCENDPVNLMDPTGLKQQYSWEIGKKEAGKTSAYNRIAKETALAPRITPDDSHSCIAVTQEFAEKWNHGGEYVGRGNRSASKMLSILTQDTQNETQVGYWKDFKITPILPENAQRVANDAKQGNDFVMSIRPHHGQIVGQDYFHPDNNPPIVFQGGFKRNPTEFGVVPLAKAQGVSANYAVTDQPAAHYFRIERVVPVGDLFQGSRPR
jgi:RHS repeat-associated protein